MKDFNWTEFTRRIAVKALKSQLYNAWTRPDEIERWFLSRAVFTQDGEETLPYSNAQSGAEYAWSWYGYDVTERGRITKANGIDHIQFTFAGECLVDVILREEHEAVVVELRQHNIPTDDASKREIRLGCASGWSFFLLNLKSVYEGGLDLRNKDDRFKGHINN